jgi:hypothetical protein
MHELYNNTSPNKVFGCGFFLTRQGYQHGLRCGLVCRQMMVGRGWNLRSNFGRIDRWLKLSND